MMKLISVAILILLIIPSNCAKFGPDNSYTCHCFKDEQCNTETGACSGHCATGWSGASCQNQNVAFGKPSSQVDTNGARTSDLAVDGRRTTSTPDDCSDTSNDGTGRWWSVDLLEEYPIKHVTIYYQYEVVSSLNGFSLTVIKENQESEQCYKDNRSTMHSLPAINDIECGQVITGLIVNISNFHTRPLNRFLALCEVEVYVCSVGTFGSDCTNFCHCLNNERCSETGQCPSRCAIGWTGKTCNQTCDGTYGDGCVKQCSDRNCLEETSSCNHITGRCQGDCKEGFIGIDCVKGCEEGVYGAGCSKKCSDRKCKDSNFQCDSSTGECIGGCRPGYQSIDCTQECDNGTYGRGCQFNCSERFCQSPNNCSNIDGTCVCSAGYNGIDCTCKMATKPFSVYIISMLVFIVGFIVGGLSDRFIMGRRVSASRSSSFTSVYQDSYLLYMQGMVQYSPSEKKIQYRKSMDNKLSMEEPFENQKSLE